LTAERWFPICLTLFMVYAVDARGR
jgi:hypothetical protein